MFLARSGREKKNFFLVFERVDKVNLPLHRKQKIKQNNEKIENKEVNTRIFLC